MSTNKETAIARTTVIRSLLARLRLPKEEAAKYADLIAVNWSALPNIAAENLAALATACADLRGKYREQRSGALLFQSVKSKEALSVIGELMDSLERLITLPGGGEIPEKAGSLFNRLRDELPLEGFEVRKSGRGKWKVCKEEV